jgi:hypothetical protein
MQVSANRVVCLLVVVVCCVRTDSNCVGLSKNIHIQLQIRVIVFNIRLRSACVDLHIRRCGLVCIYTYLCFGLASAASTCLLE